MSLNGALENNPKAEYQDFIRAIFSNMEKQALDLMFVFIEKYGRDKFLSFNISGKIKTISDEGGLKQITLIDFLITKQRCNKVVLNLLKLGVSFDFDDLDILEKLIKIDDFHNYINVEDLLDNVRFVSFESPKQFFEFDQICLKLRKFVNPNTAPLLNFETAQSPLLLRHAYLTLYGKKPPQEIMVPQNKEEAIERAIAEYYSLLATPERCIKYLKRINDEMSRYYRETHKSDFPSIDHATIEFKTIYQYEYPIPKENYIKIEKHSALQEYLLSLFVSHGLPEESYKWIGFIPNNIADQMMMRGDFMVECRMGTGLFHNKISHMLQRAILILAMHWGNEINLLYNENGKTEKINIKDILYHIINMDLSNKHTGVFIKNKSIAQLKLWGIIQDGIALNRISFADPFRLGTLIMSHGKVFNIEALSDSLIDTFCSGIKKLLTAYNEAIAPKMMTLEQYVVNLTDMNSIFFHVNPWLVAYSLERERKKTAIDFENTLVMQNEKYGIVKKEYKYNISFNP